MISELPLIDTTSSQPFINTPVSGSLLSYDATKFIEWIYLSDEWLWSAKECLWYNYGYRSRTTQQLFEYYLKKPK